jgi:hypothetical protein
MDMKDIAFDYFNIISKEYEMAFDKYKSDEDYKTKAEEIKKQIDDDYVEKRFELPASLTKEKTQQIVKLKQ